jgi:hypothetical protein
MMAHDLPGPHPLCTCPEATFTFHPDRAACRARAYPIDPHPVLEIEDIRALRTIVADLYPPGSRSSER